MAIFNCDLDDFIDAVDELPPSGPNSIKSEAMCTKPLSELEEDLDYLLQLGKGEATVQREAPLFDNFSDSNATPLLSGHQSPTIASTQSGGLERQKGMKPLELFDISLPLYDTDSDKLPVQEGRPLHPSNGEEEQPAKNSALDREVFMALIEEIQDVGEEVMEHVQLDDYYIDNDDYISDTPGSNPDAAGAFAHHELPVHSLDTVGTMKIGDEDDVQKERRKLRNAKRAARRLRIPEQPEHQLGNLYDFSIMDLRNVINVDRDARNIIIARQQERIEVEAYSPTNYHIPQDYVNSTRKCKPDSPNATAERPTRGKRTLSSQEHFEQTLYRYCLWHPSSNHFSFECIHLHRALGAPHSRKAGKKVMKEGGRTTRAMICAKIKSHFKEVFWRIFKGSSI
jgi:hypothetical protein